MEKLTYTEINWIINSLKKEAKETANYMALTDINSAAYKLLKLSQENKTNLIDKLIKAIESGSKTIRIGQ